MPIGSLQGGSAGKAHRARRHMRRRVRAAAWWGMLALLATLVGTPRALGAQESAGDAMARITAGDSALARRDPAGALREYLAALEHEPANADALTRAARAAADVGEAERDGAAKTARFRESEELARRAVAAAPASAEGHFALARALGLRALSVGVRDRVRFATEIRAAALAALERDASHPGALHVLGVWHAEVMRLNGVQRFLAKNVLGGKVFDSASWAQAVANLERAVAVDPERLTHRLDLGKIYRDTGEKAKARAMFESVVRGTAREPNDARYQQEAATALRRLDGR